MVQCYHLRGRAFGDPSMDYGDENLRFDATLRKNPELLHLPKDATEVRFCRGIEDHPHGSRWFRGPQEMLHRL